MNAPSRAAAFDAALAKDARLRALRPSQMLSRATRLTVDGVGAIDQQIAAVAAIEVDPSVVPGLASDLDALNATLAQWNAGLRDLVVGTMTSIVFLDDQLASSWDNVDRTDDAALLSFADSLRAQMAVENSDTTYLEQQLAPFSEGVDQSISRISSDLDALEAEIAAAQDRAVALNQQLKSAEDRIHYYETHPWELLFAGLSIIRLIEDMNDILRALDEANKAMSDLQQVERQIGQLSAARAPLLSLKLALTGLSGGIANMTTAIQQIGAALETILETPPLTPILSAQLAAMMADLARSEEIAREILDES
ncbi:MAG: hypothetical protein ACFE0R_18765 [Salinarimonas sp.]